MTGQWSVVRGNQLTVLGSQWWLTGERERMSVIDMVLVRQMVLLWEVVMEMVLVVS